MSILYLFTRTPLHVGAGSSVGAVDQPVQRERPTGFPVIPGSSLKGVLRDEARRRDWPTDRIERVFGAGAANESEESAAGRVSFGEGKILAFPVRSARGSFAFITCPLALQRFQREHGGLTALKVPAEPADMACLAGDLVTLARGNDIGVVLEEYAFSRAVGPAGQFPADWEGALLQLLDDPVWQAGKGRFALLNNDGFAHFVRNACEVGQHVRISDQTGTAERGGLLDLEAVPAETLFFAPLIGLARQRDELTELQTLVNQARVLQIGGDGTTGLGFCTTKVP